MTDNQDYKLTGTDGASVFRSLTEGMRVKMTNGAVGEITGNPQDGAYLMVRITENPANPSQVGEEDLVFFNDVQEVV